MDAIRNPVRRHSSLYERRLQTTRPRKTQFSSLFIDLAMRPIPLPLNTVSPTPPFRDDGQASSYEGQSIRGISPEIVRNLVAPLAVDSAVY